MFCAVILYLDGFFNVFTHGDRTLIQKHGHHEQRVDMFRVKAGRIHHSGSSPRGETRAWPQTSLVPLNGIIMDVAGKQGPRREIL